MADIIEKIEAAVKENKIMIFMKGNRSFPQCGFSAATVAIFDEFGEPYATADVLSDPELRDAIKQLQQLADDSAGVYRRQIRRRLRHHSRDARVGRARADGEGRSRRVGAAVKESRSC